MYVINSEKNEISRDLATSKILAAQKILNLKSHIGSRYGKELDVGRVLSEDALNLSIPVSVFSDKLSLLETIVKYLKENMGMGFAQIARLLDRSPSTISTTYRIAAKKISSVFIAGTYENSIPLSVIAYRKLSTFEAIVMYLKHVAGLSYVEIGRCLCRDNRNVWSIHDRAIKKVDSNTFITEIKTKLDSENSISRDDVRLVAGIQAELIDKYSLAGTDFIDIYRQIKILEPIVPVSVFCQGLSPLRAVVTYLHDQGMSFSAIARSLNRSLPLISSSYEKTPLAINDISYGVPLSALSDRRFSIMESVAYHLIHDLRLTNIQAARELKRHPAVVWKHKKRHSVKDAGKE